MRGAMMRMFVGDSTPWKPAILAALLVAVATAAAAQLPPGFSIERISIARDGGDPNARSELPATNFDGSIVGYKSAASNLIEVDTNGLVDVFAFDRNSDVTHRVPIRPETEGEPNGESYPPSIDSDGRIVAFGSAARNLVRGDFNLFPDAFAYDRFEERTENLTLVLDPLDEGRLGGRVPDLPPSVSGDGRFVVFVSDSPHFSSVDKNEQHDVFLADRLTDTIELVSITELGGVGLRSGNAPSAGGVISRDGRYVAFCSDATNMVQGGPRNVAGIFRRDLDAGVTEQIATLAPGTCLVRQYSPSINGDGQVIAFSSTLVFDEQDTNGVSDVFIWRGGTITRASVALDGGAPNGASAFASISSDGRFLAFQTEASNIVPDDTNGAQDVVVVDLDNGATARVSIREDGSQADRSSGAPAISGDGTTVAFHSLAALVFADGNGVLDVYATINVLSFTPTPEATATDTPVTPSPTSTGSPPTTPATPATPPTSGPTTPATVTTPPATATTPANGGTRTATPTDGGSRTATATASTTASPSATGRSKRGDDDGCHIAVAAAGERSHGWWLLLPFGLLWLRPRRPGA